jgi:hypothetical protein
MPTMAVWNHSPETCCSESAVCSLPEFLRLDATCVAGMKNLQVPGIIPELEKLQVPGIIPELEKLQVPGIIPELKYLQVPSVYIYLLIFSHSNASPPEPLTTS